MHVLNHNMQKGEKRSLLKQVRRSWSRQSQGFEFLVMVELISSFLYPELETQRILIFSKILDFLSHPIINLTISLLNFSNISLCSSVSLYFHPCFSLLSSSLSLSFSQRPKTIYRTKKLTYLNETRSLNAQAMKSNHRKARTKSGPEVLVQERA